jgi:citrate lyase subunit beta/citryl-CoA lyase
LNLLRSLVFVPGNRANMLERALDFKADVIMVDLEDSVPPGEKLAARETAQEWVPKLARSASQSGRRIMVRVNSLDTGLTRDELAALICPDLSGISIGKSETVWDLRDVDQLITGLEAAAGLLSGQIKMIPWIENARAVLTALELATCSPRVEAIAFGAEDYTDAMGVQRTDTGEELEFARATVAVAARAAGIGSLDTPYVQFRDPEGFRRDIQISRRLGFTGRFAIHPSQIEIINESFGPTSEEVAYANRVVEAWAEAEAQGRGSLSLDGRMIDVPVVKRARNLLALAQRIQRAET